MTNSEFRVRFAPSPTGPFHIGGARSALFNWLLAQKHGGSLILRIEDTDLERSTRESEENIKEALRWLGIVWNEGIDAGGPYGPYRQTERLQLYQEYTDKLLADGKAYYCYCTEEELEAERQALSAKGETPRYMGRCCRLSDSERQRLIAEGRKPAVRFKVPEHQQIVFHDSVRGVVSFESDGIGDFVIVKSDGIPVYNYAVVIDDALMRISHVIRAEEHLSNTPRQILLYEALGFKTPEFGHISLILGKDRTKMSKRHGATSVDQYRNLGYLPEAIINFLALLGWAPTGEQELFTAEELIEQFSMDRVAKNPAVFDIDKLNWLNAQYMKKLSTGQLLGLTLPHLIKAGYVSEEQLTPEKKAWLGMVVEAVREQLSFGAQITDHVAVFFSDDFEFESREAKDVLLDQDIPRVMEAFRNKLTALEAVDIPAMQVLLKGVAKELKLPNKKVFMPIRVALTGQTHGPELFSLVPILGRERAIKRLENSLARVQE